jgi:signal transduction histidine kinase
MSGAAARPAPQLPPEPSSQVDRQLDHQFDHQFNHQPNLGTTPPGRSPLAHLLHALNQPLTGLQCSLELAVAGPRPIEQYVRALREGLELTGRMRILVEAIREVADTQPSNPEELEPVLLDQLLHTTATDLLPVAESRSVRLVFETLAPQNPAAENPAGLPVYADRRSLASLLFRFLESALSLTREGSELRIAAAPEGQHASLVVAWNPGPPPEHSPFSRPEVGLLIARAGWEGAGAEWIHTRTESTETCTVRLPLAPPLAAR